MIRLSLFGLLALGVGCEPEEPKAEEPVDLGPEAEPLELPELTGIDLPAAYREALVTAMTINLDSAWKANVSALELRHTGCPDVYVGAPPVEDNNFDMDDGVPGVSWYDFCSTPGGLYYGGYNYWNGDVAAEGTVDSAEGRTLVGSREMLASGVVGDDNSVMFEFDGEGSDSLTLTEATGYSRWVYSSLVNATVTGTLIREDGGGWRTGMYLNATGGDADTLEARGNVFFFVPQIQARFDSIAMDLTYAGANGAGPDTCTLEPQGWIGLRDADAFWYDLVFQPSEVEEGASLDPKYSACDGCGTLYVRGIETIEYGEVCVDFSGLWDDGPVTLPAPEDFIFTLRQL
ncbi:MAG: hypothetical protein AAFV53_02775 [Myxococcota bacterium]